MQQVKTIEQFNKWAADREIKLLDNFEGFKVGDKVTFTNDYGVKFHDMTVLGISEDVSFYGRNIYLDSDCYWFPKHPNSLKKTKN